MPLSDSYPSLKDWKPAKPPVASVDQKPQLPDKTTQINPGLRCVLPLDLQYQPDTLRQFNRPGISGFRLSPSSPSAAVNAAAQGVSQVVSASPVADIDTDIESVASNVQGVTDYTIQHTDNNTLISLTNNAGGTVTLPVGFTGGIGNTSYVQSGAADNFGVSVSVPLTSITAKNSLIVFATGSAFDSTTNVPITSITDGHNTYTLLKNVVFFGSPGGQLNNLSMWVATNVVAGSYTITAHVTSGTNRFLMMTVLEYTPAAFTFDGESTIHSSGSPQSALTPPVVTTGSTDLLFGVAVHQSTTTNPVFIAGGGYTMRQTFFEQPLIGWAMAVADLQVTPAGSYTAAMHSVDATHEFQLTLFAAKLAISAPTLPLPAGFYTWVQNTGTGVFTLSAGTSIDGSRSSVLLNPGQGLLLVFDGFKWWTNRGIGAIVNKTQATLDFGKNQSLTVREDSTASVTVLAPWVSGTTVLTATPTSGLDHPSPDEAAAEGMTVAVGSIVPGVSFVVTALAPNGTNNQYLINIVGLG